MKLIRQRKPTRMPRYDYSSSGCYFVTIVTKNKENYLGKIATNKVELTNIGEIAKSCWLQIPKHFSGIRLDEFVIMPNHIHGIIVILNKTGDANSSSRFSSEITDRSKMDLSKIIQAFKSSVTRKINQDPTDDYFAWQKSFMTISSTAIRNWCKYVVISLKILLIMQMSNFSEIKNSDLEIFLL